MSDPLEKFEILSELSSEQRQDLLAFTEERRYDDGRTLFQRGEEAAELFLLVEGEVRLEANGETLGDLAAGAAFGGASLVRIGKRACDARASSPIRVRKLTRESYLRLSVDCPPVALALLEGILRSFASTVHRALP